MLRCIQLWSCAVALVVGFGSWAPVRAQGGEGKDLDTLEGYKQLPGEKGVKKALTDVQNQPIETAIVWSEAKPSSGPAPLKVEFNVEPPAGVQAPAYAWNFGDGSPGAQGAKVAHTFQKPGMYRVLIKVTGAAGSLGEDELRIKVTP